MRRAGSMTFLRISAASLFATVVLFASRASAAFQNDFSKYPAGAQSCLYQAADQSGCDGDTVNEMNTCLCGNEKGGFVILTAQCLGPDSPDLAETYSFMSTNCAGSNTPMDVSQAQWFAAASGSATASTATQTTATSAKSSITSTHIETITQSGTTLTTLVTSTGQVTETSTSTSSSSPTSTGKSGGGTNTALIGGIAGGVAVVLLAVIGVVYFVLRRRVNAATKGKDESHPMLNNPGGGSNGGSGSIPVVGGVGVFGGTNSPANSPSPNPIGWAPPPTSPSAMSAATGGYKDDKGEWRPTSTVWTATPPPPQNAASWGGSPGQQQGPWIQPQPYQGAGTYYQGAVELPPQTATQTYELGDTGVAQRPAEMPGYTVPPQNT